MHRSGRAATSCRWARAPLRLASHMGFDLIDLFVGQTSQCRALARHAGSRADVDEHLAVELQLFR